MFKKYLVQEVIRGDGVEKKKFMGKRIVNVTKLLSDLSFWAEVERYCVCMHQPLSIQVTIVVSDGIGTRILLM